MRLDTVSAVVTGASGGIGSLICRRLVAGGARVLLVGRSADRLGSLARELADLPRQPSSAGGSDSRYRSHGQEAVPDSRHEDCRERVDVLAVDLTLPEGRLAVRDAANARRVNVLVNGAAIPSFGPLESLRDDHLEAVMATNLMAPIALTRLLLPILRSAPQASILNIGSTLGSIGMPGFTVYGAAKAGLRTFSESLRRELAGEKVRVQFLGARATRTGFNDARVDAFNALTHTNTDLPGAVAAAAVELLQNGRGERYLGFPEALLVRLNALVPTWIDSGFKRHRIALNRQCPAPTNLPAKDVS